MTGCTDCDDMDLAYEWERTKRIEAESTVRRLLACKFCKPFIGTGRIPGPEGMQECPKCDGRGEMTLEPTDA